MNHGEHGEHGAVKVMPGGKIGDANASRFFLSSVSSVLSVVFFFLQVGANSSPTKTPCAGALPAARCYFPTGDTQSMLHATINYITHEFAEGISILAALQSLSIEVPTLCHDERLKPCGSCRMCEVTVQGIAHPVASCVTALADGMVIESHAPELERERRGLLKMAAEHYPLYRARA